MLTSTLLNIIVAYLFFTIFNRYINALPITSKPIEGTAEHLAWQAWLMLPPEQKNLEKSRKVTPKSIFTLPFRECPNGHQLFENRCIPTVNIDQTALLTQQLLGFVVGDNNDESNYEFDYDDINVDEIADIMYEPVQKLNGGSDNSKDTYHYDQLPSQDEPLKFNIFQQKFPTDYEAESIPIDEPDEQVTKTTAFAVNSTISFAEAVNATEPKEPNTNLNITPNQKNNTVDLQTESSNMSVNVAVLNDFSQHKSVGITTPTTVFSISDIDAIVLPAMPTHNTTMNLESDSVSNKQNIHRISLFKDDSSVQLVTSPLLAERYNEKQQEPDLAQLLKADTLLPLPNVTTTTIPSNIDNLGSLTKAMRTKIATRTISTFNDDEVSTLTALKGVEPTITTTTIPLSGNNGEFLSGEGTDMMLSDTDATLPTLINDSLEKEAKKVSPLSESENGDSKKGEHPQSVITYNTTSAMTEPQEEKFMTTTEPDITTNFQVDETTVNEVHDAPAIALKELLELAEHPFVDVRENLGVVVKKSKVEPVEVPPIVRIETEADSSIITTSTQQSETVPVSSTKSIMNLPATKITEESASSVITEILKVISTSTSTSKSSPAKTDRFDDQQLVNVNKTLYGNKPDERQRNSNMKDDFDGEDDNDYRHDDSKLRNVETTTTTTTTKRITPASEIDIKQELLMINELVKGNNKRKQHQIKGGIIKLKTDSSSTTSITESGYTTTAAPTAAASTAFVEKPTKSTKSSNKDKITGSAKQATTINDEESRISPLIKNPTTPMSVQTITKDSTTTTTSSTPLSNEPTSTIWSKIMPFFGFSTSFDETPIQATETTTNQKRIISTTASPASVTRQSSRSYVDSSSKSSIANDRSSRNSKIIRISNLSKSSYSDTDSNSNSNSNSNSDSNRESSTRSNNNHFFDKQLQSNTEPSTATTTTKTTTTDINDRNDRRSTSRTDDNTSSTSPKEIDPFWWIPIGWRLDRTDESDEPSLLLRLWSTIPENKSTRQL